MVNILNKIENWFSFFFFTLITMIIARKINDTITTPVTLRAFMVGSGHLAHEKSDSG